MNRRLLTTSAIVLAFSATGSFKRSDFGSNFLLGPVGDEVTVLIELEFLKK